MQTESEFNKSLKENLELYEYHKTILWWERLQSGKVQTVHLGWINLCRKGTPDWIVAYLDKQKHLALLFVEGKSDSGMMVKRQTQDDFAAKYPFFKIIRTNMVDEVKSFIETNSYDRMKGWSEEVDLFMNKPKEEEEEY